MAARQETLRAPRWIIPLVLVSSVALAVWSTNTLGFGRLGWVVSLVVAWAWMRVARRHNRAKGSTIASLRRLAVIMGLTGVPLAIEAMTNRSVGWIARGVAVLVLIVLVVHDDKVR